VVSWIDSLHLLLSSCALLLRGKEAETGVTASALLPFCKHSSSKGKKAGRDRVRVSTQDSTDLASKTGRMRFVNSRFWGVYEVGERSLLKFGPQKNAKKLSFPGIEPRLPNQ
jgi:hypothetical protein